MLLEDGTGAAGPSTCGIWPSGEILHEDQVLIQMFAMPDAHDGGRAVQLPSQMLCSTSEDPVTLLWRNAMGQVRVWRLHHSSTWVEADHALHDNGALMAVSHCGQWIAVEENTGPEKGEEKVHIWLYKHLKGSSQARKAATPQQIATINARPVCMCIVGVQEGDSSSGLLAVTPNTPGRTGGGSPSSPHGSVIQVFSILQDGGYSAVYNVQIHTLCTQMRFCPHDLSSLLAVFDDGVVGRVELLQTPRGTYRILHSYAAPGVKSANLSADGRLLICSFGGSFKVMKAPSRTIASLTI